MYLAIAGVLVLVYVTLKPLSHGLLDTSAWVAKILAPSDIDDEAMKRLFLRTSQAAMMEGWVSNVPFFNAIVSIAAIVVGFIHSWWGGVLVFFGEGTLGALAKIMFGQPVSFYLSLIHHKMANRAADYRAKNDAERAAACEEYCKDLERIMLIYQGSGLRPPTRRQVKDVPYGDLYHWLHWGQGRQVAGGG
jgi:hypothetical protein